MIRSFCRRCCLCAAAFKLPLVVAVCIADTAVVGGLPSAVAATVVTIPAVCRQDEAGSHHRTARVSRKYFPTVSLYVMLLPAATVSTYFTATIPGLLASISLHVLLVVVLLLPLLELVALPPFLLELQFTSLLGPKHQKGGAIGDFSFVCVTG